MTVTCCNCSTVYTTHPSIAVGSKDGNDCKTCGAAADAIY